MDSTKLLNLEINNNVISTPTVNVGLSDGLGTLFYHKLKESGNKTFQINGYTGEIDTASAFLQRCVRTAIAMRARGLTPDDIITVCSSNHFNTSVPIVASFLLGVKPANTDPNLTLSDTIHLLKLVKPKIIFASVNAVTLIENVLKETGMISEIVVFGNTEQHTPFDQFLNESEKENGFEPYKVNNLKETAAILFSSGTSGLSKGICLSHLAILEHTVTVREANINVADLVMLSSSLVYWISYLVSLVVSVFGNAARLILPNFKPNTIWNYIEKYKVGILLLSPTQIATLLESSKPKQHNVSSVFLVLFGGSSISEHQMKKLRGYFPNAITFCGYGTTELGGGGLSFSITSAHDLYLLNTKPTSCGRPLPGRTYKIVDPDTEEVIGPNKEGELRIKTEFQMSGYYNMDASNQWDSDGFFKTGDIAYYDNDYCFYIVGRAKEMLKYRGWQITPVKLEGILATHPAVQDVVVLGIPHPVDVEHPVALVVLHADYVDTIRSEHIKEYYENKVSNVHKLRGGLKFVEKIVKNSAGKINRRHMLKQLLVDSLS